jgi:4-hydroxy-tetrahydrodipicolinate synthase
MVMTTIFKGSMVAIVTPFKDDGAIDEDALRKLIDIQIENGTDGLVPCGTTGESATLSHAEHETVISITVEQAAGRAKVLAGAGSNSTAEACKLTKFCEKVGADGTLHITPYYNKPTQEGLFRHFQAIAKSSDLPIMLYNVPSRTSINMLPATTIRLAEIENIVGVKEASGSLDHAHEIIQNTPADFALLSGEDSLTYPLYCIGAKGAISVTCNVAPKLCAEQYSAVSKDDFIRAREIHEQLYGLHQALFVETNPIPVKAALSLMGLIEEEYRLPLVPLSSQYREQLKKVLTDKGLLF